jgi:sulfide:quinone oxidoreductase
MVRPVRARRQIAKDMGRMTAEQADQALQLMVYCIGDMANNQTFCIRSNSWHGGDTRVLEMGHVPFLLKVQYKNLFSRTHGKTPPWGSDTTELMAEPLFALALSLWPPTTSRRSP